jgi:hypothetical protein
MKERELNESVARIAVMGCTYLRSDKPKERDHLRGNTHKSEEKF